MKEMGRSKQDKMELWLAGQKVRSEIDAVAPCEPSPRTQQDPPDVLPPRAGRLGDHDVPSQPSGPRPETPSSRSGPGLFPATTSLVGA